MAPSIFKLKELRRRSKASFRTERSTDDSSEASNNTAPTSGSSTPPSIGAVSDPALDLQLKEQDHVYPQAAVPRPQSHAYLNGGSNRYSVSGMMGLGSPVPGGRGSSLPVSQYSPRITNVADNSWVGDTELVPAAGSRSLTHLVGLPKGPPSPWHHRGVNPPTGRWYIDGEPAR